MIQEAKYIISSPDVASCPQSTLPEYAFIGRSNVGKSSLINMLTGVKDLAKTSSKPGKTQLINHFLINNEWHLVDLPGYGYARTSKANRGTWQKMISDYMLKREQLTNVFVLVDSRIPPQAIDLEFIHFLGINGVPMSIIFTKTDKQKQREIAATVNRYKAILGEEWEELPMLFLSSAATGSGRDHILDYIESINKQLSSI